MSCSHDHCQAHQHDAQTKIPLYQIVTTLVGIIIFVIGLLLLNQQYWFAKYVMIGSYLLIGYEIIINAVKRLFKKDMFDENLLMTIATVGALVLGEYTEAIAVLLFYKVGEFLQQLAVNRSRKKIESALNLKIESATVRRDNDMMVVSPEEIQVGDIIIVKVGEKVPVDGVVIDGNSSLDMKLLTGESVPKTITEGQDILSGSLNLGMKLEIKATKTYRSSTIAEIIDLIQNAVNKKSDVEKYVTKFAKVYTPIVIIIAVLIIVLLPLLFQVAFSVALSRAFTFLVISCPCALVISVPLGFFMGIGQSGKHGILIKGSNYLDILSNVTTVVLDKTGTLTEGVFVVVKIEANAGRTKEEVLEYIAYAESFSNHYIAKSILDSFDHEIDQSKIKEYTEIAGYGIEAKIDGISVLVGNEKLMDKNKIVYQKRQDMGTIIYLAIDGVYAGYLVISDKIKKGSVDLVQNLKKQGVRNVVMLTGDNANVATKIGEMLKFDQVFADLLPKDKLAILLRLKQESKGEIAYVGDGINDGPCLVEADVGIAMGKGADIAIETSDIVIMTDEIEKVSQSITIANKTKQIVNENIFFAIGIKIVFLTLSLLGIADMWEAVFADVGVSILVILNCLRIMSKDKT